MTEDYHRPPIVAIEPRSHRAAIWRFRIILGAALALLGLIIVWLAHSIIAHNDETGGTVGGLRHAVVAVSASR